MGALWNMRELRVGFTEEGEGKDLLHNEYEKRLTSADK
jgi:hypothetical protein